MITLVAQRCESSIALRASERSLICMRSLMDLEVAFLSKRLPTRMAIREKKLACELRSLALFDMLAQSMNPQTVLPSEGLLAVSAHEFACLLILHNSFLGGSRNLFIWIPETESLGLLREGISCEGGIWGSGAAW